MAEQNEKLTDIPILHYEDCGEETRNMLDELLVNEEIDRMQEYEQMLKEEVENEQMFNESLDRMMEDEQIFEDGIQRMCEAMLEYEDPFFMTFKEIMNLRKVGERQETYEKAIEFFHHNNDNIWAKRSLAWCIYDDLKVNATYTNKEKFMSRLSELKALKIPANETMIWKNIVWMINAFVRDCAKSKNISDEIFDKLFESIKEFYFVKPSREYSVLLDAFLTAKEWKRILNFCEWWNFKNFRKEDYEYEELSDGRKMPISLVENAYRTCAKVLMNSKDKEAISAFIPKLQQLAENYPQMQYPNYYVEQLFLALRSVNAHSVEDIRKTHSKAYAKWTPDAESELGLLYEQGWSIEQLMEHFGRNEGGIRSRLMKIGKIE